MQPHRQQPTRLLWPWDSPFPSLMHACVLSHFSCVRLCETPWTAAHQAPLSTGFSRQEYWSGLPLPSPFLSYKRASRRVSSLQQDRTGVIIIIILQNKETEAREWVQKFTELLDFLPHQAAFSSHPLSCFSHSLSLSRIQSF